MIGKDGVVQIAVGPRAQAPPVEAGRLGGWFGEDGGSAAAGRDRAVGDDSSLYRDVAARAAGNAATAASGGGRRVGADAWAAGALGGAGGGTAGADGRASAVSDGVGGAMGVDEIAWALGRCLSGDLDRGIGGEHGVAVVGMDVVAGGVHAGGCGSEAHGQVREAARRRPAVGHRPHQEQATTNSRQIAVRPRGVAEDFDDEFVAELASADEDTTEVLVPRRRMGSLDDIVEDLEVAVDAQKQQESSSPSALRRLSATKAGVPNTSHARRLDEFEEILLAPPAASPWSPPQRSGEAPSPFLWTNVGFDDFAKAKAGTEATSSNGVGHLPGMVGAGVGGGDQDGGAGPSRWVQDIRRPPPTRAGLPRNAAALQVDLVLENLEAPQTPTHAQRHRSPEHTPAVPSAVASSLASIGFARAAAAAKAAKEPKLTGEGSGGEHKAFAGPSGLRRTASVEEEDSLARYSGRTFQPRSLEPTAGGQQLEPAPSRGFQPWRDTPAGRAFGEDGLGTMRRLASSRAGRSLSMPPEAESPLRMARQPLPGVLLDEDGLGLSPPAPAAPGRRHPAPATRFGAPRLSGLRLAGFTSVAANRCTSLEDASRGAAFSPRPATGAAGCRRQGAMLGDTIFAPREQLQVKEEQLSSGVRRFVIG